VDERKEEQQERVGVEGRGRLRKKPRKRRRGTEEGEGMRGESGWRRTSGKRNE